MYFEVDKGPDKKGLRPRYGHRPTKPGALKNPSISWHENLATLQNLTVLWHFNFTYLNHLAILTCLLETY